MSTTLVPSRGRPVANGLGELEAAPLSRERGPVSRPASSRSYRRIVIGQRLHALQRHPGRLRRAHAAVRCPRDALFLGIVIANSAIGIVQEVRAKRTLDRLSALVAPTATVISDGRAPPRAGRGRRRR